MERRLTMSTSSAALAAGCATGRSTSGYPGATAIALDCRAAAACPSYLSAASLVNDEALSTLTGAFYSAGYAVVAYWPPLPAAAPAFVTVAGVRRPRSGLGWFVNCGA